MEEDIKILEKFITKPVNDLACAFIDIPYPIIQRSIRSVLNRLQQLEKENKELKQITQAYDSYKHSIKGSPGIVIADSEHFACGYFKENYISKDKIKQNIQELEELLKEELTQVTYWNEMQYTIRVLKKILGGNPNDSVNN